MPARPPIYMGQYDPANFRDESRKLVKADGQQVVKPGHEWSTSASETELRIAGSELTLTIPTIVATTVWDVKELIASRLGVAPDTMTFIAKQGCYWREKRDCEEIGKKVTIKGIKSFERSRTEYPHPIGIIGAGHIGLRQAMIFMKYKCYDFVIFDKKPKVGGQSWWDQANTTSKLQTETGVYHLGWDETLPIPKNDYPWPSRNELLDHFQEMAAEYGILPYCKMSTEVKDLIVEGRRELTTYELTLQKADDPTAKEERFMTSGVMLYPGNLSLPRRETYKGEEEFGGVIGYGMFDELKYSEVKGKNVAIIGHGAFAVENVRTCCEYDSGKIYLVCRRKNISCPRYVSWLANQSCSPLSAVTFLNAMKPMYDLVGFDVWEYYSIQSNAARSQCTIMQKARFGIGDIYFLAISWGKLEVIEDPLGIKRLGKGMLQCGSGRKLEVDCILKLLGFVGNPENDRLMKVKELVGFWVNDDPKRYIVAEPVSVMASNFGGTSFSPGAIAWSEYGMWFMHHPQDFWDKVMPTGMLPRHKADDSDEGSYRPAYVVDARHGTSTMVFIGAAIPFLSERGGTNTQIKVERMWAMHPIEKFIEYCKEDWNHYCEKFREEGLSGPEFPYSSEQAHKYLDVYRAENKAALTKAGAPEMLQFYEGLMPKR
ncbi:unnamed protein product [Polarella glacialis]|uniref:FAD/NAD(P)-binding domain-containing protein n=1 Tax=Polarella glacialis TaxID=89957 RepID=A0A813GKD7_POLGL|nr:unnamed protein product [Polarella glacialis]